MRGTVLYGPRDIRVEERADPTIVEPTDAIIRLAATCVCGSDLWPYRGIDAVASRPRWATSTAASSRRSERGVRTIERGQFVVGSFFASDNTCPICRAGYQSRCVHAQYVARAARRPPCCASRWPTAPWSPPRRCHPTT